MNPILIFKTIGISIGLTGGITGSIFSSFQAFTKIKIEDFLKNDWFEYDNNDDWKLLKKKLDDSTNIDNKKLESTGLKGIKKQGEEEVSGNTNGEKVKGWCSTKKSFKIKKLLPSSFEHLLLDYVKSFCLITIEEKINESSRLTTYEDDKENFATKATNFGSHEDNSHGTDRGKIEDISELKKIKDQEEEKRKESLFYWCKETYKKSYKGSGDNLWKVANYYCKKTS